MILLRKFFIVGVVTFVTFTLIFFLGPTELFSDSFTSFVDTFSHGASLVETPMRTISSLIMGSSDDKAFTVIRWKEHGVDYYVLCDYFSSRRGNSSHVTVYNCSYQSGVSYFDITDMLGNQPGLSVAGVTDVTRGAFWYHFYDASGNLLFEPHVIFSFSDYSNFEDAYKSLFGWRGGR